MIRKKKNEIEWLEFTLLQGEGVAHGCFLRHGGVSRPPYDSLNVSSFSKDAPENVKENRRRINEVLSLPTSLYARCEHKDRLLEARRGTLKREGDGFFTEEKGVGIGFSLADCQGAIFYDPMNKALAVVHAGWRGQVAQIYTKTIGVMKKRFFSRPENLLVCISPSLGPLHAQFIHFEQELTPFFYPYKINPCYFDLWGAAEEELLREGILSGHIEIAKMCTYEGEKDFFSYRRDKVRLGMAFLAAI